VLWETQLTLSPPKTVLDEIKQKQDRERGERENRKGIRLAEKDSDVDGEGHDFDLQRTSLSNIT
jgi:hypothetical protein